MSFRTVSLLPPSLLDLTTLHLNAGRTGKTRNAVFHWQRVAGCRRISQAAEISHGSPPSFERSIESGANRSVMNYGLMPMRKHSERGLRKVQELERKVQALEEALKVDSLGFNPLTYTEEELLALYEDVLSVPVPQPTVSEDKRGAIENTQLEEDRKILKELDKRLHNHVHEDEPHYRRILIRAFEVVSRAENARQVVQVDSESSKPLPLGVLSHVECEALIRAALKAGDDQSATIALEVMRKDHMSLPEATVTKILRLYSDNGNVQAADFLLESFLNVKPNEMQRHFHIKVHLKATPSNLIPTSALDLLHHYEIQNIPAPMQTYTSVITSLFSRPSSLARAQAWDIFTHMRYVAHPIPDVLLYTLMIRACASPVTTRYSSEPEKALDLWTEMTVDQNISPTIGAYNAVILACARSGTKTYVNEAFRLARQMLDSHRDASGYSPFRPDKKTFCALLEGAKRIGDLGRARWILAEMVKGSQDGTNPIEAEVDEEVMMHVFHAYAAYDVPFLRSSAKFVSSAGTRAQATSPPTEERRVASIAPNDSHSQSELSADHDSDGAQMSFAHIPPQTRGEVIKEVEILLGHISKDRKGTPPVTSSSFLQSRFKGVELTTRLLNSYLSVFYKHAPLETAQEQFWKLFEDAGGLSRSPRTYVEALERCGNSRRGSERAVALDFADQLWPRWKAIEADCNDSKPLNPRLIERAYVAMIRVLAVNEKIIEAVTLLRSFVATYPPNAIRKPSPKFHFQSTRTSLVGSRPLVRMTSAAEVPDDNVPPLLTFRDLELLHHRLIDVGRQKDIKFVTWICKAYEWALRIRRDETIRAKPVQIKP